MNEQSVDPAAPVAATPELCAEHFINRELSWLAFNERVLDEASNTGYPLLERLRFLSISDNNLDEFYMVRVSGLMELAKLPIPPVGPDGLTPSEQLAAIRQRVAALTTVQQRCWHELTGLLREQSVTMLEVDHLFQLVFNQTLPNSLIQLNNPPTGTWFALVNIFSIDLILVQLIIFRLLLNNIQRTFDRK